MAKNVKKLFTATKKKKREKKGGEVRLAQETERQQSSENY
jgi:hypothetical protein